MEKVQQSWGYVQGLKVSRMGTRGGLSLCWREGCLVTLRSFSRNHIDTLIEYDPNGHSWRFMGFYGHPEELN
ncbi:hypothetical protein J1N35_019619 [Gossypium stocksii]|uniref:Uncharacterized protein n=1 Tax=Gossypium stocksii TaxID=47602 RepID=A0A9D4A628_9ROSI|nr:hypothetical protein J1N35_019619 [Gossypium stocksii]